MYLIIILLAALVLIEVIKAASLLRCRIDSSYAAATDVDNIVVIANNDTISIDGILARQAAAGYIFVSAFPHDEDTVYLFFTRKNVRTFEKGGCNDK